MSRILVIQHVACEGPALLAELAAARGHSLAIVAPFRGEPIPPTLDADALVLLGGPMGVYEADRHPHLGDEQALARAAVASGRPVLGICLGSQLLAAAHGAAVVPTGRQEIGFYPIAIAGDDPLFAGIAGCTPLHWHGDAFALPDGAVALASSALTPLQAYRLGANAWGLLFHLEATPAWVEACATEFADELRGHGIDPQALIDAAPAACAALAPVAAQVLGRWLDRI
ncbi:MAG: gamma-glutamyl-gamma-aminobutyrate hydrolase family protein [Deltaproteobacteria bacterium]|nr:gamma-glutamyl-gamma-aminobutyrate hydrolase family protein [Deltaproteobacteria bacterium]